MTLAGNRLLRLTTLCSLYVAQGIPFGFLSIALKNDLHGRGLTPEVTAPVLAYISIPWTFKAIWGPIMDRFGYAAMGRRRPWILFAQAMVVASLFAFSGVEGIDENLTLLAAVIFVTNLFSSMQDVATDALAVDLTPAKERGRTSSLLYSASYLGTFVGGTLIGSLLFRYGIQAAMIAQGFVLLAIMILPLLFAERAGEKRFPWSRGEAHVPEDESGAHSFRELIALVIAAFNRRVAIAAALFAALVHIGNTALDVLRSDFIINDLGWTDEDFSWIEGYGVWFGLAGCFAGFAADRIGARKLIAFASVVLALWWIGFACSESFWERNQFISAFVLGEEFLKALLSVAMFAFFMSIASHRVAATQFTTYMALLNLSMFAGRRLAGALDTSMSLGTVYIAAAAFQIIILVLVFVPAKKAA